MKIDLPFLSIFSKNYCERNQKMICNRIEAMANYFEHRKFTKDELPGNFTLEISKIVDIDKIHLQYFFREYVDNLKMSVETKKKFKTQLNQYFIFLVDHSVIQNNPMPSKISFQDTFVSQRQINNKMIPIANYEQINQLLQHSRIKNVKLMIDLLIAIPNGCRPSEIVSIKLDSINLENRTIITGIVDNYSKKPLETYFIAKGTEYLIEDYINNLKRTYRDPIWLFPSNESKTGFLNTSAIQKAMRESSKILQLNNIRTNPYVCRHLINDYRLFHGCNDSIMSILLNQVPKGSNGAHYLKLIGNDPLRRRYFFDKFTPAFDRSKFRFYDPDPSNEELSEFIKF